MRTDYILEDAEVRFIINAIKFYGNNQSPDRPDWKWVNDMIEKIKQELS